MELDLSSLQRSIEYEPVHRNQSRQQLDDIAVEIREQQDEESKEERKENRLLIVENQESSSPAAGEPFPIPSTVPRNVIAAELLQHQNQTEESKEVDNEIGQNPTDLVVPSSAALNQEPAQDAIN